MNDEQYLLFEDYLNNDLNFEEKENFENQLKSDPALAESFAIYKELNSHLQYKFATDQQLTSFKANLQSANKSMTKKNVKIFAIKPFYYAIAACFALVFGLMIYNTSQTDPTFENYYQKQTANFTDRGDVIKTLKQAQDAFNKDDYKLAASLFEIILKSYPRPEIEFFYGVSLMNINKFQESETAFNNLIAGNSVYKNTSTWNLALLKLKQKNFAACKATLLTIPQDYEDYAKVKDLLNHLQ